MPSFYSDCCVSNFTSAPFSVYNLSWINEGQSLITNHGKIWFSSTRLQLFVYQSTATTDRFISSEAQGTHAHTHTHVLMYDPCKNRIPIYEKRCYNYVHSHRCALILYKMTNLFCTQTHVNSLPQFVFALGVCTCISTGSSSHRRRISSLRTDAYNLSVEHLVNLFHIKWMFLLSFLFKSMSFAPFAHCLQFLPLNLIPLASATVVTSPLSFFK